MFKDNSKNIYLGIGFGPIQTGIFLSGAEGNFERLVVAEIDSKVVDAVRRAGGKITINIAGKDSVIRKDICGIEIYNPLINKDLEKLIELTSSATEIATALPSVNAFAKIAGWLGDALSLNTNESVFIYTAENNNHAAEILEKEIGKRFDSVHFLNTVIGKMSGVLSQEECIGRGLAPLCEGAGRGHLVEEFNKILISNCPCVEKRKVRGLYVKKNLLSYEEAKLYGHNAVHFLFGMHASLRGLRYMHELRNHSDIILIGKSAFIEESGAALLKKWHKEEDFFDESTFRDYAEDLIERMTNPFLCDAVERVCRDLERKLSWDDRIIGTIRLCVSQSVSCPNFGYIGRVASERLFATKDICEIRKGLCCLWGEVSTVEREKILEIILRG